MTFAVAVPFAGRFTDEGSTFAVQPAGINEFSVSMLNDTLDAVPVKFLTVICVLPFAP